MKTYLYLIISKIKSQLTKNIFCYVGVTSNDPRKRKSGHFSELRKKIHANPKLQNHFNKYGENDLEFKIIRTYENKDIFELEKLYILIFNSIKNGFNIMSGGNKPPVSNTRKFKIKNIITNEEYSGENMLKFCKERGLKNCSALSNMLDGRTYSYYGWTNPEIKWDLKRKHKHSLKYIENPERKIFAFRNTAIFSKEHGLSHGCLNLLISKKISTHKGWVIPGSKPKQKWPDKILKLKNPSGEIIEFKNISQLCKQNNLAQCEISKVLNGQINHHRFWTFPENNTPLEQPKGLKNPNIIKLIYKNTLLLISNQRKFEYEFGIYRKTLTDFIKSNNKFLKNFKKFEEGDIYNNIKIVGFSFQKTTGEKIEGLSIQEIANKYNYCPFQLLSLWKKQIKQYKDLTKI